MSTQGLTPIRSALRALSLSILLGLNACGGGQNHAPATSGLSAMAAVGKQLFFDTTLSASGKQACSSCHDPDHAYTAPNALSVQLGGTGLNLPGLRNTPSLRYSSYTPAFNIGADGTAQGGFFLDGRSPSLEDQAQHPFLNSFEMANVSSASVQQQLLTRPYRAQFVQVFGTAVLQDPDATLHSIGLALAAFEKEDPSFHPFSSKYDYWTRGQAQLSAPELHGLALFNTPNKGNCAACHVSTGNNGTPALFTDFTYDNIGVPRNWAIAANSDGSSLSYVPQNGAALGAPNHNYYDLGLCGPLRTNPSVGSTHCGQFKVPTLRNVALKQAYFHNGVFHTLLDAVSFYITRDTQPQRWYVQADGSSPDIGYNDLPTQFDANVNALEVPYNPALAPTLNTGEITDLVAFLCTLTDGYNPATPNNYANAAQCPGATPTHF